MTKTSASSSLISMELPFTPVLLGQIPRPRSPCWYQGELWALAGWRLSNGWGQEGNYEPLARFDGKRWLFYPTPLPDPEVMVCDGRGILIVDQDGREPQAYYSDEGHPWQRVPMPPQTQDNGGQKWRFAGGGAIVAYSPREIWRWKDRAWQPVPWPLPHADTMVARVVPEEVHRWFLVTFRPLGSDWDAAVGHLSGATEPKRKQAEAQKLVAGLDKVWGLIRSNKLPQARAALAPILARYPHDGQVLFCEERLVSREEPSRQASLTRIEQTLTHAQGRLGRARLYNAYGCVLDELGQHQAMLPWFERAASEYPDPIHFANLAEAYEKLGKREDAARWAHRALVAGSNSELCIRILHEQGIARPSPTKDMGAYLWSIATFELRGGTVDADRPALTALETRTMRLDYGDGDGPFHESSGHARKVLPRYLQPTGLGVWPDDVDETTGLRVGPRFDADHVRHWIDRERSNPETSDPTAANNAVLVFKHEFDIGRPLADPKRVAYVPFAVPRSQDNRLEPLNLDRVHVVGSQVYLPWHDAAKNRTVIFRFEIENGQRSELLGSIRGEPRPFFLGEEPVWLITEASPKGRSGKSRTRSNQLSLYSLDGRQRITDGPQVVEGETLYSTRATRQNFLESSRGVYRFHNGIWTLFTYQQLGIEVVNLPLPSLKPGPDIALGRPQVLAGHTLWIRNNAWSFWSVDLDQPDAGTHPYSPRTVQSLTDVTARWTVGTVDDGKILLASDEHLTIVDLPARWGDLLFVASDIVQTRHIGLIRLR